MLAFIAGLFIGLIVMFVLAAWLIGYAVGSPKFWEAFFKDLGG